METGELHELAELQEIDGWSVRWSPDGRQLAMLGWPEGGKVNEVFVVPASGGEARRLTGENGRYKEGLEWHPNGESLTFMSYGPDGVWQVRLDGSPPEPLIDQPDLWDYVGRWSPTGNHLYFVSARRGAETPWNLHVYDEAAGSVRRVWSSGEGSAGLPSFSHDGESLTWSVTRGSSQLWLMENFE